MRVHEASLAGQRAEARSTARVLAPPSRPALVVAAAGIVITVVYALATMEIPLPEYFPGPGISLGFPDILGTDWQRIAVQYTAVVVLSFLGYGAALIATW